MRKVYWTSFLAFIFDSKTSITHRGLCIYKPAPWFPNRVIIIYLVALSLDLLADTPIIFHFEEGHCTVMKSSPSL